MITINIYNNKGYQKTFLKKQIMFMKQYFQIKFELILTLHMIYLINVLKNNCFEMYCYV